MVLTSVDLYYWEKESKKILKESRIQNIYFSEGIFILKIYKTGNKTNYLYFKPGEYIFLSESKTIQAKRNSLVEYLRKQIKRGSIIESSVVKGERILILKIKKKEETLELIFELFRPGNLIITRNNIIKNLYLRKNFKDRRLQVGEKYLYPPKKQLKINPNIKEELSVVKYIAIRIGLGGKYAEEIIERSRINKEKKIKELTKEEIEKLNQMIKNILNQDIDPYNNKDVTEFYPFKPLSIKAHLIKTESFNLALKNVFSKEVTKKNTEAVEKTNKELAKLKERIKKLKERKEEIKKEIKILQEKGNKIYENYSLISDILESIKKGEISKYKTIIKKINKEKRTIEIEID